MPSIRSRIIIGLIKNRYLFKGKLKPEKVDSGFSVEKFREDVDRATARMKMPQGVSTEKLDVNGLKAEWIVPGQAAENKVLMYIHGGGFISGSCLTHRMHVAKFALGSRLKSLVFDYRLAPEHPFRPRWTIAWPCINGCWTRAVGRGTWWWAANPPEAP